MRDAAARGRTMTAEEHFDSQTISERTTYDAVTHALMGSDLTDGDGNPLGTALDIVAGIERVAGQYYGRGGDQQFRLYVDLKPAAVETLERSVEFFDGKENTVYHVGYPYSFRQEGDVPNMQVSVSEDGLRADVDVDYRSSKNPQALFNGHLTSANSDVRAGDNVDRHNGRWAGMIAWCRGVFGDLPGGQEGPQGMLAAGSAAEVPTPLPPDRPVGASIERPEDAVQEFLTDWLVRREIDEAMAFMSDRAYACVNIDDDARYEALDAGGARAALRDAMHHAGEQMGELHSLTEAVDAVPPLTPRSPAHPAYLRRRIRHGRAESRGGGAVPLRTGAGADVRQVISRRALPLQTWGERGARLALDAGGGPVAARLVSGLRDVGVTSRVPRRMIPPRPTYSNRSTG